MISVYDIPYPTGYSTLSGGIGGYPAGKGRVSGGIGGYPAG